MTFLKCSVLVVVVLVADNASAKNVEDKERTARTACLAGDYAKGVAILSELFVETQDAGFIYNQGRCFEQNHRYDDAISRFQEYLRVNTLTLTP
jgi:tetratricopeptide (TPR) repeat protein